MNGFHFLVSILQFLHFTVSIFNITVFLLQFSFDILPKSICSNLIASKVFAKNFSGTSVKLQVSGRFCDLQSTFFKLSNSDA